MFAKLAQFGAFGRRHASSFAAKGVHRNDPARRMATLSQRAMRPVLVCGWRQVPATGRLECFWQVVPVDLAAAEEPEITWVIVRLRCILNGLCYVAYIANCSQGCTVVVPG